MIYFCRRESDGFVKIGTTTNLETRFRTLRRLNPGTKLEILGTIFGSYTTESALHRHFREIHVKGKWHKPDQELLDFIRDKERKYKPEKREKGKPAKRDNDRLPLTDRQLKLRRYLIREMKREGESVELIAAVLNLSAIRVYQILRTIKTHCDERRSFQDVIMEVSNPDVE